MFGGNPSFGQKATPAPGTGLTFPSATSTPGAGLFSNTTAAATPPSGFQFGTQQPQQTQPQQPAAAGFSFPQTTAQSQPGGGFQFPAATSTVAPNVSLFSNTLGANQNKPAVAPAPSFGFGTTPSQTATAQPTLGTGFSLQKPATATTTATSGFSFGLNAPASTAAPTLAPTLATSAAPPLNFGFGSNTTTAAAPSLTAAAPATSIAQLAPASTAAGFGFNLGAPAATTAAPTSQPLSFGLGLSTNTLTATSQSAPVLSGLGGVSSFNVGKTATLATKPEQLKENPLTSLSAAPAQVKPANYKDEFIADEMKVLVESFKAFVKEQKSFSSAVNRASLKQITKVTEDAETMKKITMQLERLVNKNKALNRKLCEDVARGIQDAEVVQRLSIDPRRGFPADNSLAFDYFKNMVDRFQQQSESLTVELKNTEKHIVSKLNPTPFTPEELSAIMKHLYNCFIALAGRYQSIHAAVTSLKLEMQRKKDPWYMTGGQRY